MYINQLTIRSRVGEWLWTSQPKRVIPESTCTSLDCMLCHMEYFCEQVLLIMTKEQHHYVKRSNDVFIVFVYLCCQVLDISFSIFPYVYLRNIWHLFDNLCRKLKCIVFIYKSSAIALFQVSFVYRIWHLCKFKAPRLESVSLFYFRNTRETWFFCPMQLSILCQAMRMCLISYRKW